MKWVTHHPALGDTRAGLQRIAKTRDSTALTFRIIALTAGYVYCRSRASCPSPAQGRVSGAQVARCVTPRWWKDVLRPRACQNRVPQQRLAYVLEAAPPERAALSMLHSWRRTARLSGVGQPQFRDAQASAFPWSSGLRCWAAPQRSHVELKRHDHEECQGWYVC